MYLAFTHDNSTHSKQQVLLLKRYVLKRGPVAFTFDFHHFCCHHRLPWDLTVVSVTAIDKVGFNKNVIHKLDVVTISKIDVKNCL